MPPFERSYSREDTCSLNSVNESMTDAYDSDTYFPSLTSNFSQNSPAVERRHEHRPPRLKFRWSTVFEEEENKKEKTMKKSSTNDGCNSGHKLKINSSGESRLYNYRSDCDTPKSSSRFSKSPKKEKDNRRGITQSASALSSPSVTSPTSPKSGHRKFQLLSPRSDRRMKETCSESKRNSGCSDASSGIGSSSSHSQSSSLHSNEDMLTDDVCVVEDETPPKSKYWPFRLVNIFDLQLYHNFILEEGKYGAYSVVFERRKK